MSARRDGLVRAAVWIVAAFVLLAIGAPLLASNRPFVLVVPAGQGGSGFGRLPDGVSFPWFRALFDRLLHDAWIDRCFNGLLVALVAILAIRVVMGGIAIVRRLRRDRAVAVKSQSGPWPLRAAISCAFLFAILAATFADTSGPTRDYGGRVDTLRSRGVEVTAVFAPIRFGPGDLDKASGLSGSSAAHPLGTDEIGHDVAARLAYGARSALVVALLSVLVAYSIGVVIGALAGYRGGVFDLLISRLIDVVACLPFFVIVIALIAVTGRHSIWHIVLIFGAFGWDGVARLVRAEFLKLREFDATLAARALGLPESRIVFRHLLPPALTPLLTTVGFSVASMMLVDATVAFLGLTDPTAPSWGQVLRSGRDTQAAHLILWPGILIFCVVTSIHVLADAVRAKLEPRLTEARR